MSRLTIKILHDTIGITPDTAGYGTVFGPKSRDKLSTFLSNKKALALTDADYAAAAARLGVPIGHMKGSHKIEAPRGAYDELGRPSILYERHKFSANTEPAHKFDKTNPLISGGPYGPGGYGAFSAQYPKLFDAIALDPEAAIRACSWGAFQVLGENAVAIGYGSAWEMVASLVHGEAAHLDTYVRFIEANNLTAKLRACKPHDAVSCQPFVSVYNGKGYKDFNYDTKFAEAIAV